MTTNDIKNGMSLIFEGRLVQVVEFQRVKPGKGASFVRARLRDFKSGQLLDQTWKGEQKLEPAFIESRKFEYIYRDGDHYYFMEQETYEQVPVDAELVGAGAKFLKENTPATLMVHGAEIVAVNLPDFVILEVTQTDPGVRGDTATGSFKPATLETGATVQVPLFVTQGDHVKVDARTGAYVERA